MQLHDNHKIRSAHCIHKKADKSYDLSAFCIISKTCQNRHDMLFHAYQMGHLTI